MFRLGSAGCIVAYVFAHNSRSFGAMPPQTAISSVARDPKRNGTVTIARWPRMSVTVKLMPATRTARWSAALSAAAVAGLEYCGPQAVAAHGMWFAQLASTTVNNSMLSTSFRWYYLAISTRAAHCARQSVQSLSPRYAGENNVLASKVDICHSRSVRCSWRRTQGSTRALIVPLFKASDQISIAVCQAWSRPPEASAIQKRPPSMRQRLTNCCWNGV